jgi:hypothetical protein
LIYFQKEKQWSEFTVCRPNESGRSTGPLWTSQWPAPRGRPSGRRSGAQEASELRGDPSGGLTSDRGAVRQTGDGGERSSAAAIGVERLGGAHFTGPGGGAEEVRRPVAVEY